MDDVIQACRQILQLRLHLDQAPLTRQAHAPHVNVTNTTALLTHDKGPSRLPMSRRDRLLHGPGGPLLLRHQRVSDAVNVSARDGDGG